MHTTSFHAVAASQGHLAKVGMMVLHAGHVRGVVRGRFNANVDNAKEVWPHVWGGLRQEGSHDRTTVCNVQLLS